MYKFLSSAWLAMALLVIILGCCILGVTVWRGAEAGRLIFGAIWFNGLLVLLVVNVAFCFFPRMWGRKLTLISFGMILFHLSFVAILGGIVYNSLFYFRGLIRLTEGESLPGGDPRSYDTVSHGRFFSFSKMKGEIALIKMHRGYTLDGQDKRAAYEIAVGEAGSKKQGIMYITNSLDHEGVTYLNDREGYSVLVILYDRQGRELYGAFVPLQSLKQKDDTYLYTTGTKAGPGSFPFPQEPLKPLLTLQIAYKPSKISERGGDAFFQVWSIRNTDEEPGEKPLVEDKKAIGEKLDVGDYFISLKEVRYWVGMMVLYEPGKPVVLASLWAGFGGMVLTFIGRLRRGKKKAAGDQS